MSPAVICVEKSVTLHHDMSNFADGCTHKILSEYTEGLERYGKIKQWDGQTDEWMTLKHIFLFGLNQIKFTVNPENS